MLNHPHFFTIEAWVRMNQNTTLYGPAMTLDPGIVFHKIGPMGIHFGIDFGT